MKTRALWALLMHFSGWVLGTNMQGLYRRDQLTGAAHVLVMSKQRMTKHGILARADLDREGEGEKRHEGKGKIKGGSNERREAQKGH